MAGPKQKQPPARTRRRRARQKTASPSVNACPTCHSPRRPHRVCPVCGSYRGREVVSPAGPGRAHYHPHWPPGPMPAIAVDANGADLGAREVALGAADAGVPVLLFGPAAEIGEVPQHVTVVDAPVSIAKEADPARAARSTPEASIVQAAVAVAEGRADALVSAGSTGAALA